jgi:hypothetical protein
LFTRFSFRLLKLRSDHNTAGIRRVLPEALAFFIQ